MGRGDDVDRTPLALVAPRSGDHQQRLVMPPITTEPTMYLFIFEDGSVKQGRELSNSDLQDVEYGVLQVIRLDDSGPKEYFEGEWLSVESV